MAEVAVQGAVVPAEATAESRPDLFGTRGQLRPDGDGGMLSYMAADKPEYATPDVSQVERGVYVLDRGTPWHVTLSRQLGTPELMQGVDHLLTVDDVLGMGIMPKEYRREDIFLADGTKVPDKFAVVRADTGAPVGVVGKSYIIHQPGDAFRWADALVDDGQAKFETAGLMRGGAWLFLSAELNHLDITVPGDPSELKTYLLIKTSYDGGSRTEARVTHVRTVCKNTYELADRKAISRFSVRHVSSLQGKVIQAREALGIAFKNTELLRELTAKLATTSLLDAQLRDIVERVWPTRVGTDGEEKVSKHVEGVLTTYQSSPNLEGIRGTAWGGFNAVTEYLDHGVKHHGKDATEARAWWLLYGDGRRFKDQVMKELVRV